MEPKIIIVSPHKFQNSAICHFIEKETGIPCESIENPDAESLQGHCDSNTCALILWDYQANEPRKLWENLSTVDNNGGHSDKLYIAVYNVNKDEDIEKKLLIRGAKGVFFENDSLELIKKGIKAILNGELWFSRKILASCVLESIESGDISKIAAEDRELPTLTSREEEILIQVAAGRTNSEIAKSLYISASTVKTHVYNIFQKINVPNRIQAALWTVKYLSSKNQQT